MNKPRSQRTPLEIHKHVHIHPQRISCAFNSLMEKFRTPKQATVYDRRTLVPRVLYRGIMDKMPKNKLTRFLRHVVAKKVG